MTERYKARCDQRGTWTVYDTATGWPALLKGRAQTGLSAGEADHLVDVLNCGRVVVLRSRAEAG